MIVMEPNTQNADIEAVVARIASIGCESHVSHGQERSVIGATGDQGELQQLPWEAMVGVERAVPVLKSFKLVSRDFQTEDTVIEVRGVKIGAGSFTAMAGPCAVENRDQLFRSAEAVVKSGAKVLRGDAFKPRTSPYSFQGLGEAGLQLMAEAREEFNVPFIAEVLDPRDVEMVASYADILRIGTRNMSNYTLLTEVGRQLRPVQLKRGFTSSIEEWLSAAEFMYKEGNHQIMLVERGIRTFEIASRNTLDITAVPILKKLSHLPVIVDPSHSGGYQYLVAPLARVAVAAGADGFLIDVHHSPETAQVDGGQALLPSEFEDLMVVIRKLADAMGVTVT